MRALIPFICFLVCISCSKGEPEMETILAGLDTHNKPGHNFYEYVNQHWIDANEPGTDPTSFSGVVQDTMKARFFRVLEDIRVNKPEFAYLNELKDQFFDWEKRDSLGIGPLEEEMALIFGDSSSLATIFARMQKRGYATPFYFDLFYSGDTIYSRMRFERVRNASLGRYFDEQQIDFADTTVREILAKGNVEIGEMELDILMSLKNSIDELKNTDYGIHKLTIEEADSVFSNFDLIGFEKDFYCQTNLPLVLPPSPVIHTLDGLLRRYNREDWIRLLKFYVVYENLSLLSQSDLEFIVSFNPRVSNHNYYEMVCRLYLTRVLAKEYESRFLHEQDLERVKIMIDEIRDEFDRKISSSDYMNEIEKRNLKSHIENIHFNYRIPDAELFTGSYAVGDNLLETIRAIGNQFNERYINYVLEGTRDEKYLIDPVDYFISYEGRRNTVNIPFPFLMYPYFDAEQPMTLNYGALGFFIGHEIGHSFDPYSLYFDSDSIEIFHKARHDLISQYNSYSIEHGNVDGWLTLGENWCDLVGMECALNGFLNSEYYEPGREIKGFDDRQWLFLSRAFIERRNSDAESYKDYLANDEHSPPETRINATFRNLDQFYEVFDINTSDSLYLEPEKRVRIW